MTNHYYLAEQVFGQPLLIAPEKLTVILGVLEPEIGEATINVELDANLSAVFEARVDRKTNTKKINGVSIVNMSGTLVARGAWLNSNSGLISYDGLYHQLEKLVADKTVKTIILDINSGGGQAAGCFDLCTKIREWRKSKKIIACVNHIAASGAYAIAASCNEIVVSELGMVGSIGVVQVHSEASKMLEKIGRKYTIIKSGEHKADGNPYEPLGEKALQNIQKMSTDFYNQFLQVVEDGRLTKFSSAQARETEARVYTGQQAVDMGLADRMGTLETILLELKQPAKGNASTRAIYKGNKMSDETLAPEMTATELQSKLDAAEAKGIKISAVKHEEVKTAGIKLGIERTVALLEAGQEQNKPKFALSLAKKTNLDAEMALELLNEAAAETQAPAPNVETPPATTYAERKHDAGTLGVSTVVEAPVQAPAGETAAVKPAINTQDIYNKRNGVQS